MATSARGETFSERAPVGLTDVELLQLRLFSRLLKQKAPSTVPSMAERIDKASGHIARLIHRPRPRPSSEQPRARAKGRIVDSSEKQRLHPVDLSNLYPLIQSVSAAPTVGMRLSEDAQFKERLAIVMAANGWASPRAGDPAAAQR